MWQINDEIEFFKNALKGGFANVKDLFYSIDDKHLAYIPKEIKQNIPTLQSRNALIGNYTETWCQKLLAPMARKFNLYAVNGVVCEELGLIKSSRADLAFCTTNEINQQAKNIKLVFEIKMSIVNNYQLNDNNVIFIGDYKTHKAHPSLTRSDSVLKAIGKAINIRVSSESARSVPIVILGNTHISNNYLNKIDHLGQYGVLQKIISLNSAIDSIKNSPLEYFETPQNINALEKILEYILKQNFYYFSAMLDKKKLGEIIQKSANFENEIQIAEYFLKKLKEVR
ncbi:hypothetical protein [Campylobacter vulpis]|uniref:hypothetical protein n=1 Tax=Campylobacter vulpis TaxID=1655500 RepID=UPI001BCDA3A8|nr:hypothetical protein [Campylobacter vulpis]MBS4235931.1 hypothetical protein [Campylobacter vulpis]MBS4269501.1 hypothetical protein [Campylobacter vulpis]